MASAWQRADDIGEAAGLDERRHPEAMARTLLACAEPAIIGW
jgi:hypothetical protein